MNERERKKEKNLALCVLLSECVSVVSYGLEYVGFGDV